MRALFLVAIVLMQLPPGMPPATHMFKVSGRVLTSSGEPLRGKNHLILIGYGEGDHSTNGTYAIEDDGSFHCDLPPRRYLFTAAAELTPKGEVKPLEDRGYSAVTVRGADVSGVIIQMRPRVRVRGRARYDADRSGTTYPSVNIFSVPAFDGLGVLVGEESAQWFGSDGSFELVVGAVPVVIRNGYSTRQDLWWPGPVLLDGRDITDVPTDFSKTHGELEVVFTQRPIGVFGIVTEESTQLPAESASVVIFPEDPTQRQPWSEGTRLVAADDQGRFWKSLSPGRYFAVAFPAGTLASQADIFRDLNAFEPLSTPFTIDPERRGARVHLVLSRPLPARRSPPD
jgi:hypothetical protein